jgi:hypothetical protein
MNEWRTDTSFVIRFSHSLPAGRQRNSLVYLGRSTGIKLHSSKKGEFWPFSVIVFGI